MSFATARRDIEKRFDANWASTLIAWDNVNFVPPKDDHWVRFSIRDGSVQRKNIGAAGTFRHFGIIFVQLYAPKDTGTQVLRGYADDVAGIFRDARFNGVVCQEAELTNIGVTKASALSSGSLPYYQINISIPFYWDGTYTFTG